MHTEIRPWQTQDAAVLSAILDNKKIHDNIRDGLPLPYTAADALSYISAMQGSDPNTTYAWAITADGALVGSIGVFRKDNVHRLTAEIGYYIGEGCWGKGIATEAIILACRYIFENTDIVRIFAEPYDFNIGSCRALEKAGFVYEGTLRNNAYKNGKIVDMKMYALVRVS